MHGKLKSWPAWREYVPEKDGYYLKDPDYAACKSSVIEQYGKGALEAAWLQVCQDLEVVTSHLSEKKSSCIPIFDGEKLLEQGFLEDQRAQIKQYGCFIVRRTIPEDTATYLYEELKTYVANNKAHIQGWPAESPSMLLLYDSPTQIAARTHPKHLQLQKLLNQLWHDESGETSPEPLLYSDGVRDRPPHQQFLGLGPHIDAGSLCRWGDPSYRKYYHHIFSGNTRQHDAFNLGVRKDANQILFPGFGHSTVFRSFQGWTALTKAAAGEGTIMLYPNISAAIAYILLRPFFRPPPDNRDVMDASKWTFDATDAWFPGTFKEDSQYLSRLSHPHLRLEDCLVHAPPIQPGDSVWWHTDVSDIQPRHSNRSLKYHSFAMRLILNMLVTSMLVLHISLPVQPQLRIRNI